MLFPIEMRIEDTIIRFGISGYKPGNMRGEEDEEWCDVSLSVENSYFNYHRHDELMLMYEVDSLKNSLMNLLEGKLSGDTKIDFIEPDYEFILFPKTEKSCILMEMKINLWLDGALSSHSYSMLFNHEEIQIILDYLEKLTKSA